MELIAALDALVPSNVTLGSVALVVLAAYAASHGPYLRQERIRVLRGGAEWILTAGAAWVGGVVIVLLASFLDYRGLIGDSEGLPRALMGLAPGGFFAILLLAGVQIVSEASNSALPWTEAAGREPPNGWHDIRPRRVIVYVVASSLLWLSMALLAVGPLPLWAYYAIGVVGALLIGRRHRYPLASLGILAVLRDAVVAKWAAGVAWATVAIGFVVMVLDVSITLPGSILIAVALIAALIAAALAVSMSQICSPTNPWGWVAASSVALSVWSAVGGVAASYSGEPSHAFGAMAVSWGALLCASVTTHAWLGGDLVPKRDDIVRMWSQAAGPLGTNNPSTGTEIMQFVQEVVWYVATHPGTTYSQLRARKPQTSPLAIRVALLMELINVSFPLRDFYGMNAHERVRRLTQDPNLDGPVTLSDCGAEFLVKKSGAAQD